MSGGPLEGIRVVDLTSVVVGPLATQTLADYGAEVIKVEAPGGDIARNLAGRARTPNMSAKFLHLNRNKRSIVLDLKKPEGREAVLKLAERADVFLFNVRPSAMQRLRLTYDDVQAVNPGIVYCGLFGFGRGGRYREKPAYDLVIQGASGISALLHRASGEPRYVPITIADRTVGGIAVQMILMALLQRTRTGKGASIEVPMFENMVKYVLEEHMYLKTFVPPMGPTGDPRLFETSSRPIQTKDHWIAMSANTDAHAFALFDAIGKPELKTDPRFSSVAARFANIAEYLTVRAEAFKTKTTSEWLEILEKADVPAIAYHTLDSVMEDPHLRDVGFFQKIEHPTEGTVINMALPNKLSTGDRKTFLPAPKIGQQSVEILREAGYSEQEISRLIEAGVTLDGSLRDAREDEVKRR